MRYPIQNPAVERVYLSFPQPAREGLLTPRDLIFEMASKTEGVGELTETLKWNQPAYVTAETKSGSTIRLGLPKTGGFAIYAHCQTSIIPDFRELYPDDFTYESNRAIHFIPGQRLPIPKLRKLIRSALTYRLN